MVLRACTFLLNDARGRQWWTRTKIEYLLHLIFILSVIYIQRTVASTLLVDYTTAEWCSFQFNHLRHGLLPIYQADRSIRWSGTPLDFYHLSEKYGAVSTDMEHAQPYQSLALIERQQLRFFVDP